MSLTSHTNRPAPLTRVGAPPSQLARAARRTHLLRISAQQASASTSVDGGVQQATDLLKRAAAEPSVPPTQVFAALRDLEKAKLPAEGWAQAVGGTPGGRRWRLIFTSGTKQVQEAMKGSGKGGGKYFPLTAVQRWDAAAGQIQNGIFLGHVAALTFSGPYAFSGKKLSFDFDTLSLKLGPAKFDVPLKKKIQDYKPCGKDPFFLFFYADDDIVAARGRSGGVAFWARTSPQWELENGVV